MLKSGSSTKERLSSPVIPLLATELSLPATDDLLKATVVPLLATEAPLIKTIEPFLLYLKLYYMASGFNKKISILEIKYGYFLLLKC